MKFLKHRAMGVASSDGSVGGAIGAAVQVIREWPVMKICALRRCNVTAVALVTALAGLSTAALSTTSRAAVVSTSVSYQSCLLGIPADSDTASSGSVLSGASCNVVNANRTVSSSLSSRAEIGSLGVAASADMSINSSTGPTGSFVTKGTSEASFSDTLTFGGTAPASGTFQIFIDVAGNLNYNIPPSANLSTVPGAGAHLTVKGNAVFQEDVTGTGSSNQSFNESLVVDVPYTSGTLFLNMLLRTTFDCGFFNASGISAGTTLCSIDIDFFGSSIITGAQVLDGTTIIDGATIVSDSGFDYREGFTVSAVPLPAALPLFFSALAGLGLMGWRRRQADA